MRNIKKGLVLLIITSIISLTVIPSAASQKFTDVKSTSWYYSYVTKLVDLKITGGYADGTYKPNNSVTRAEFVTFLCNAKGYKQMQGNPFVDSQKSWASGYITTALANGIIDIPSDQKFNPNYAITRQDAVEMLCRALNISPDEAAKTPYADVTSNPGYSTAAFSNYLMTGTTDEEKRYFSPTSKITRAEAATIIVNAYDYNLDKIAYLNRKIAEEKQKKDEAEKYAIWKESVNGISLVLLNNKEGLYNGSAYESNKYLKEESDYLKNWGAKYGMTEDEFAKEVVRVGSKYATLIANANYKNIKEYESVLKSVLETNMVNNYMDMKLDYVKDNTIVSEGKFTTSTGLIIVTGDGSIALRGTIKYKYSKPTSNKILNAEIVGSTKKASQLGVWYEQDIEISFYPEVEGLKTTGMQHISDIRISK